MKPNQEIRDFLNSKGLYIWQLAELVGVHETTMTKWLRMPLNVEQKQRVAEAIKELEKKQ